MCFMLARIVYIVFIMARRVSDVSKPQHVNENINLQVCIWSNKKETTCDDVSNIVLLQNIQLIISDSTIDNARLISDQNA